MLAMVGSARQALWASIVCKRSPTSWPVKSSTKTAESGTSCSARCKTANLRSCPPARLPARLATVPLRPNRALLYRISVRVASSSYTARIIVKGPRLANQGNPGLMLPRQGNGTEGTPRSPPTGIQLIMTCSSSMRGQRSRGQILSGSISLSRVYVRVCTVDTGIRLRGRQNPPETTRSTPVP